MTRMNVMGRKQKQVLFDRFFEIAKEWDGVENDLINLVDEGRVASGCLLVHTRSASHSYRKISDSFNGPKEYHWQNITGWDLQYHIGRMAEGMQHAKAFVAAHKLDLAGVFGHNG